MGGQSPSLLVVGYAKGIDRGENVQLIRISDAGNFGTAHYSGLYFLVDGKEMFYALSDWMLHKLIIDLQAKCVMPDCHVGNPQTPKTSALSTPETLAYHPTDCSPHVKLKDSQCREKI